MATQYTTILKLALPAQGELSGTWGDVVNDNITSMVEEAIAGRAVINTWAANSHTLTTADGTTAESRAAMLELTDTGTALTGAGEVICPAQSKLYAVKNDTGQAITVKTSAGTGISIPDGTSMFVFCDGTNVEEVITNFNTLKYNDFTLNFGGAVTTAGAFTTSGANSLTLTTTGTTDVTLPTTGTLSTLDGTETLTNKTLTSPSISDPTITGTIDAVNIDLEGNTTIGSDTSDDLTVNALVSSNLLFEDDTYDIGANGATRPRTLYLSADLSVGNDASITNDLEVLNDVAVTNNFAINTNKFTVTGSSGNTSIAGTLGVTGTSTLAAVGMSGNLAINTNKLTVDSATGNTAVAGTLGVTGTSSLAGVDMSGNLAINTNKFTVDSATGNTVVAGTLSVTGNLDLTDAIDIADGGTNATTAAGARTNLGLAIGSDVQAYDAGLTSIAGLTTSADKMIYTTASDTYAVTSITAFGRSILDDADAATVRSTIDVDQAGTAVALAIALG